MSEPRAVPSNQNTGRDPNAQGPSPLDLLQRQNERLMDFLRSFIAGSESQDFRPWGRQLYRELYSGTHETAADGRQWRWFANFYGAVLGRVKTANSLDDAKCLAKSALEREWSSEETTACRCPGPLRAPFCPVHGDQALPVRQLGPNAAPVLGAEASGDRQASQKATVDAGGCFCGHPDADKCPKHAVKASEQECRSAGPSGNAAGTGPVDPGAEARSSRREVTAQNASAPMVEPGPDLTCEGFIPDPHSRFCDRCGYPQHEHKRAQNGLGDGT